MDRAELRAVEADERDRHRAWLAREEHRQAVREEMIRRQQANDGGCGSGLGLGGC